MAEINKSDVKLYASQRLDDTDQGGGAMTSSEVVDGEVNNLFPDISRLDRVYGRVSLRKAFMAIITTDRATYYGAHTVLTQQAADPLVGVCFFTTEDWFDVRTAAASRIEGYLVKGPQLGLTLFADHYQGTRALKFYTSPTGQIPSVGDVLVMETQEDLNGQPILLIDQFVRITELSSELQTFTVLNPSGQTQDVEKMVVDISIGNALEEDFPGEDVTITTTFTGNSTLVYESVVSDASRYYGMSVLAEEATAGTLQVRADTIYTELVPSAQSETAIVDATVGTVVSPMIQSQTTPTVVTRTISYDIVTAGRDYIGEGILPDTLQITSLGVTDNGKGDVLQGAQVIGAIAYATGIITWSANIGSGTTSWSYVPACPPNRYTEADGFVIDIANRGFVYTYFCDPIPAKMTLKVDYMAGGKWYSLWDHGGGEMKGSDPAIGSGVLNYVTGSVSLSLGAMPDVDSMLIFFWTTPETFYDISGDTVNFEYDFTLQDTGVAITTFQMQWTVDVDTHKVYDDGAGGLDYQLNAEAPVTGIGTIKYSTGDVNIHSLPVTPLNAQVFDISYDQGPPTVEVFTNPAPVSDNRFELTLSNTSAIVPKSVTVSWTNRVTKYKQSDFDPAWWDYVFYSFIPGQSTKSFKFQDDGAGALEDEGINTSPNWIPAVITYTGGAGQVALSPDRVEQILSQQLKYMAIGGGNV